MSETFFYFGKNAQYGNPKIMLCANRVPSTIYIYLHDTHITWVFIYIIYIYTYIFIYIIYIYTYIFIYIIYIYTYIYIYIITYIIYIYNLEYASHRYIHF